MTHAMLFTGVDVKGAKRNYKLKNKPAEGGADQGATTEDEAAPDEESKNENEESNDKEAELCHKHINAIRTTESARRDILLITSCKQRNYGQHNSNKCMIVTLMYENIFGKHALSPGQDTQANNSQISSSQ